MATTMHRAHPPADSTVERRTIPFDYAFIYDNTKPNPNPLKGVPGTVHNSTVTVSIEATFVAVSIGFGVIPDTSPVRFTPQAPTGAPPPAGSLLQFVPFLGALAAEFNETIPASGQIPVSTAAALRNGIRLNPVFADTVLNQNANSALNLGDLFEVVSPTREDVQFLYAIFDEGTGREFQSDPILSTAGLGISNGERPFRYFARPIEFRPQSTIRMQITEVSNFQGDLHVSLQGYKVLGGAGTPTGRIRQRIGRTGHR
jgi:hypothetical protein